MARTDARRAQANRASIIGLLVLLFLCGVVIDAAHTWVDAYFHVKALSGFLGVMEDGGEMAVVSLTCAYLLGRLKRR